MSGEDQPRAAAPWPSPRGAWWAVSVFALACVLAYTDRLIIGLMVDPIRADLHITDTQVSLVQGIAFALIYACAGVPFGRLADVFARRWVIVAGILAWSLGTAACGLAHSFPQLFAARILVGVGEASLAPAAMSMIGDLFAPQKRGAAVGVFLLGALVGGGAALAIGGALLEAAGAGLFHALPVVGSLAPWRASLVILCLPGLLIAALLLTVREPVRRGLLEAGGQGGDRPMPLAEVAREFARRRRFLVPLYLAMALTSVADFAVTSWAPAMISRRFGLPMGGIGATMGLIAVVGGVLGAMGGGLLADRLARRGGVRARIGLAFASAVLGLAGVVLGLAASAGLTYALMAVWMLASSTSGPIGITAIQGLVPNRMRGLAISLISFGNMLLGLGLGPTLTALATDNLYRNPAAVGLSITTVAAPAALLSAVLFWRAMAAVEDVEAKAPEEAAQAPTIA